MMTRASTMSRPPIGPRALPASERMQLMRARRSADGMPAIDRVRRALVSAMADLPIASRKRVVDEMLAAVPEAERAGFEKVAKDLLSMNDVQEQ